MALHDNVKCYLGDHDRPDLIVRLLNDALKDAEAGEPPSAVTIPVTRSVVHAFVFGNAYADERRATTPLDGFTELMEATRRHLHSKVAERFDGVVRGWVEANRGRIAAIDQRALAAAFSFEAETARMNAKN